MPDKKKEIGGIFIERIDKRGNIINYPAWRYHMFYEPKIVNNTDEDDIARAQGWENPNSPITAVQAFNNFVHDLEDMNERQLVLYAKEEYGVDLPAKAGKPKLLKAIWDIAKIAPKNEGRMILLAQSIEMNYDETQKEIQRMAGELEKCDEITKEEVWL